MAVPDRWAASARRLFAELGESRLEAVPGGEKMGQRSTFNRWNWQTGGILKMIKLWTYCTIISRV